MHNFRIHKQFLQNITLKIQIVASALKQIFHVRPSKIMQFYKNNTYPAKPGDTCQSRVFHRILLIIILFTPTLYCNNYSFVSELQKPPLWTSASSEGQFCGLEMNFSWCTIKNNVLNNTQLLETTPKGNSSDGNCVTLGLSENMASAQLSLAPCTDSKYYMCQVLLKFYDQ